MIDYLHARFVQHPERHQGVTWQEVRAKIEGNQKLLQVLAAMEASGGEPDLVAFPEDLGGLCFVDCAKESPEGRRSLCYDPAALASRKANKPQGSACGMAEEMGVQLLSAEQYHYLQTLDMFDLKTSSWVQTPERIRKLGGALFGDRRFDTTFIYHNGAESYYAARGFRALLRM
jgi:hypothetical protein